MLARVEPAGSRRARLYCDAPLRGVPCDARSCGPSHDSLRELRSFLGTEATDDHIEKALGHLMNQGFVKVDSATGVSYPQFPTSAAATSGP
jgi:hypothetical protein